ncbi:MAG: hypothetical protein ACOC1O_02820 [bacterium]
MENFKKWELKPIELANDLDNVKIDIENEKIDIENEKISFRRVNNGSKEGRGKNKSDKRQNGRL